MKNSLEQFNRRCEQTEERISELEDRSNEIIQSEEHKEKRMNENKESLRNLWDTINNTNMKVMGILHGDEREKRAERISEERVVENFPNFILIYMHPRSFMNSKQDKLIDPHRHVIIKLSKAKGKEKIQKATKEKQLVMYKGSSIDKQPISHQKTWQSEISGMTYLKCRKKKTVN